MNVASERLSPDKQEDTDTFLEQARDLDRAIARRLDFRVEFREDWEWWDRNDQQIGGYVLLDAQAQLYQGVARSEAEAWLRCPHWATDMNEATRLLQPEDILSLIHLDDGWIAKLNAGLVVSGKFPAQAIARAWLSAKA